jgi:hypothetical protein
VAKKISKTFMPDSTGSLSRRPIRFQPDLDFSFTDFAVAGGGANFLLAENFLVYIKAQRPHGNP